MRFRCVFDVAAVCSMRFRCVFDVAAVCSMRFRCVFDVAAVCVRCSVSYWHTTTESEQQCKVAGIVHSPSPHPLTDLADKSTLTLPDRVLDDTSTRFCLRSPVQSTTLCHPVQPEPCGLLIQTFRCSISHTACMRAIATDPSSSSLNPALTPSQTTTISGTCHWHTRADVPPLFARHVSTMMSVLESPTRLVRLHRLRLLPPLLLLRSPHASPPSTARLLRRLQRRRASRKPLQQAACSCSIVPYSTRCTTPAPV